MSVTMNIRKNENDRKKINKKTAVLASVTCDIKEDTSLFSPVMLVSRSALGENWAAGNYADIPEFGGRYYFIDDVTAATGNMLEFHLTVDPLMSYAGKIMGTAFQIARSEDLSSPYYVDTEKPLQTSKFVEKHILGHIPQDLTGNKYVITVAGGT
mgnify:CR=1 FL=1